MEKFTVNGAEVAALPEGVGQKVALDDETKAALSGFLAKNKDNPEYQAFISGEDKDRLDKLAETGEYSEAQKLLQERRKQRHESRIKCEIEGMSFWFRKVSYNHSVEVALMVQRDGHNILNIRSGEGVESVTSAILCEVVCKEDGSPFFNPRDAEDYMAEEGEAELVSALLEKCLEVNPNLIKVPPKKA